MAGNWLDPQVVEPENPFPGMSTAEFERIEARIREAGRLGLIVLRRRPKARIRAYSNADIRSAIKHGFLHWVKSDRSAARWFGIDASGHIRFFTIGLGGLEFIEMTPPFLNDFRWLGRTRVELL